MGKISSSDTAYVSSSKHVLGERGVFANKNIKKGDVIESCPVIELSESDSAVEGSFLLTYFYFLGEKKERVILCLGFGSMYNHTDTPNAFYKERLEEMEMDFIALRDIKKDEEITVSYSQNNEREKIPLWFVSK